MATTVVTEIQPQLIRSFQELGRADVEFAGGKGANLGELTRAGFSVPPGFVVGAPVLSGAVRAQRLGSGNGRRYTLGYRGADRAGNTAVCATGIFAPHDQQGEKGR